MKLRLVFPLFLSVLAFQAHAFTRGDADQCVPLAKWVNISSSTPVPASQLLPTLAAAQVVLLGEDHDSAEHHRWQLDTIIQLHTLQKELVIGFEMFPRRVQPILDQWIAGKLSEVQFLEDVEWDRVWSYSAQYYMPILHYARMHKIPLLALNVERALVSAVGEKGWENIPLAEKEGVGKPAAASEIYVNLLAEIYGQHMPSGHGESKDSPISVEKIQNSPGFKRFIQGQQLWDRAMAEKIATVLPHEGTKLVVGVMGAGHIMRGAAVPYQLADLGVDSSKVFSLMPWDGVLDCSQLQSGMTDYAFGLMQFADSEKEQEHPKLGIYLEAAENGVQIAKLEPNSIASDLGLKPDDIIFEMAGKPVSKVTDVIKQVRATAFGTWLPFKVRRVKKELEFVAKFPAR